MPDAKDPRGTSSLATDGVIPRAIEAIRKAKLNLLVVTDVCLCEYTDHGHCGVIENDEILNDPTLEILAQQALVHARAGADVVAPSDMMDGRVAAIRGKLDDHKFENIPIMSYAAKYCSGFYGPFREAAQSAPQFGDRRSYQMDPANGREALKEVAQDLDEGADIVMVKPALPYLDIIRMVRDRVGRACCRIQRQWRILDGQGRRTEWLDRRKASRVGSSDRNSACRRGNYFDLPRERCCSLAEIINRRCPNDRNASADKTSSHSLKSHFREGGKSPRGRRQQPRPRISFGGRGATDH